MQHSDGTTEVTLFICPRCQTRQLRSPFTGDFQHTCIGEEALRNEEVLVIGDWEDFTGSDLTVGVVTNFKGVENELFGTRADIEGQQFESRTSRGFPRNRFRTRQHIHHIEDSFFKIPSVKRTDNPDEFSE